MGDITPVERLAQYVRERHGTNQSFENMVSALKAQEKSNITRAMLYALDEDGHTGDWKLHWVEAYYQKNLADQSAEVPMPAEERETWEEIQEEYHKDEYPVFGGPFTDALSPWQWLETYYQTPERKPTENHSNPLP